MRQSIAILMLCAGLVPGWAHAQKMYRCGSVYQDRPCSGVDSKVVGGAGSLGGQGETSAPIDPACEAQGAAAQRLMWEKESGRTLEEQLAKGVNAGFARSVYARRGSSVQVRRAIEAECVSNLEKERASGAPREMDAARAPAPMAGDSAGLSRPRRAESEEVTAWQAAQKQKASDCADFRADLNRIQREQREGGDAARMDGLREQVRDVQSKQRARGC